MKLPSDRSVESPKATTDSKYQSTFKPANKPAMKSNAFNKTAAQGQAKTVAGGVAGATATARTINNKPASPFKPTNASGIQTNVNSVAQNNAMKNAMRTDNRLESKPSAQKPINSAFKPAASTAAAKPEASAPAAKPVSMQTPQGLSEPSALAMNPLQGNG